jgi:methyltransferase (TIGR00027 family)
MDRGVSRTAAFVALWRAIESSRSPATRLFEDPLAQTFLGWRYRWALRVSRLPGVGAVLPWSLVDGHWPGPRGTVAVRTRYIDDLVQAALRRGVNQIVILGAGFDSRAYRIQGIAGARVLEVDHPVTQADKRNRITSRLGTIPSHVRFVPVDFSTETLDTVLCRAGCRGDATTFFICEGVTHYLSAEAVDAMFRSVARSSAAGSQMVFTYIHRGILDGSARFAGADQTLATVRRAGEPYKFGFDPAELPQYLAARDFLLVEDVGASTLRDRYLTPLGRGQEPLTEFQRAALVEISGQSHEASGRGRPTDISPASPRLEGAC